MPTRFVSIECLSNFARADLALIWKVRWYASSQLRTTSQSPLDWDSAWPRTNSHSLRTREVFEATKAHSLSELNTWDHQAICRCLCLSWYATHSQNQSKSSSILFVASHFECIPGLLPFWSMFRIWYGTPILFAWALKQRDTADKCLASSKKQRTNFLGPFSWSYSTYCT